MRPLLLIVCLLPLAAQQPQAQPTTAAATTAADAKPAAEQKPAGDAKAPDAKAADAKPADAAPAPAPKPAADPNAENWLKGSIDFGYRWRSDVAGSMATYRSIVDLGSGPKLLGADFTIIDPKRRGFDRLDVRAYGWGGDPYSTLHVGLKRARMYDFTADYRNIAYFNMLPSYADPLLGRGITLSEQSFDMRRRIASFELDLLPGYWIVPYLAYDRNSNSGSGATAFVSQGNEYPVPNKLSDRTNLYRGGFRIELRRVHATLEQGGTSFTDDQNVYDTPGAANYGNVNTLVFGQKLNLTSLLATYGIKGNSVYTKGLITYNVASRIDLYGQFLFSQPHSDVNYQQADAGNLYLQSQILFYKSEQFLLAAASKMPHTTANLGAELRPVKGIRVVESWLTDRMHNAGSASSSLAMTGTGLSQSTAALLASSLANNYSQHQTDVIVDAAKKLTLRAGYRFVWGDARDLVLPVAGVSNSMTGTLRRNVALIGGTYRAGQKFVLTADGELGTSTGTYFRTSLYNYQKVRAQARYQVAKSLNLSADFLRLNNQNPTTGIKYDYLASQESLSLQWKPAILKYVDLIGSYSRSNMRSNLGYLMPQDLSQQQSIYRENAHTATGLLKVRLPHTATIAPTLEAGGSLFLSSGSRATSSYQPRLNLWVPFTTKFGWFTEWRYYDYGEALYLYEGFRTQVVTAGVRITR